MIVRSGDVLANQIDGEVVMLSVEKGEYYGLDLIGSEIWAMAAEPTLIADIIEALLGRYEVSHEQCRAEVLSFVEDLVQDGSLLAV